MSFQPFDSQKAQEVAIRAYYQAEFMCHEYITAEHLLSSLLLDKEIIKIFSDLNINIEKINNDLMSYFQDINKRLSFGYNPKISIAIRQIFDRAVTQALLSGKRTLKVIDILLAIISEESHASYFLKIYGINENKLNELKKSI